MQERHSLWLQITEKVKQKHTHTHTNTHTQTQIHTNTHTHTYKYSVMHTLNCLYTWGEFRKYKVNFPTTFWHIRFNIPKMDGYLHCKSWLPLTRPSFYNLFIAQLARVHFDRARAVIRINGFVFSGKAKRAYSLLHFNCQMLLPSMFRCLLPPVYLLLHR